MHLTINYNKIDDWIDRRLLTKPHGKISVFDIDNDREMYIFAKYIIKRLFELEKKGEIKSRTVYPDQTSGFTEWYV